jgi:RHS repeat-associated protein
MQWPRGPLKKSGAVTLYVDGLAYRAATNAQLNGIDPAASDPVYFGARMASGNPINGLKGYLDDVRIYGQALGQVGISNLFFDTNFNESSNYVTGANNRLISDGDNSYVYSYEGNRKVRYRLDGSGVDLYTWDHRNRLTSVNTYGPLEAAKFGFDSDEGAYIPEDTGKGVPGELLGNTHYVEANNPQQIANYLALSFDGNGDTVMGGIQDAFTLTPKGMTMTLWFKPSGTQSNQTLVTYGSLAAGESGGYQLRYSYVPGSGSSTESLQFLLNDGIGSSQTVSYVLPASIQGQWHHVAVSVALTGQITMYVDGAAVTSATNTQTAAFGNVTTPLQLGMAGTTNAYTGLLDDVRFFALPIGSTHVAWTMQHGYAENVNIGKVEYAYNARNELITRKADGDGTSGYQTEIREHYIYDEGQIVLRLNSDGGVTHRYLWTNEVDQLLADEVVGGTTLWALSDHLGTVRDLVKYDASSSALDVVHRAFDSFGNVTQEVNPTNADILFGFTGRQFDPVANLQNNLNRWYDAGVGEWISEDPIGFDSGDSNLYRYVGNGPTNGTDPFGLFDISLKFAAFIPANKGVAVIGNPVPGINWGLEPQPWNVSPIKRRFWMFGTDNRNGAGEAGTSRMSSFTVTPFDSAEIGNLEARGGTLMNTTIGLSHRIIGQYDDATNSYTYEANTLDTDTDETIVKIHKVTDLGPCVSQIVVKAQSNYPFLPGPSINYQVTWRLERNGDGSEVTVTNVGLHDQFPAYESIINGNVIYEKMPKASGPGLFNLGILPQLFFYKTVNLKD